MNPRIAHPHSPCHLQPFTLKAAGLFAVTGTALYFYFQSEKAERQKRKDAETATAKIGRPKIGGPFVLTDQNGQSFSDKDLVGKWSLVYVSRHEAARRRILKAELAADPLLLSYSLDSPTALTFALRSSTKWDWSCPPSVS